MRSIIVIFISTILYLLPSTNSASILGFAKPFFKIATKEASKAWKLYCEMFKDDPNSIPGELHDLAIFLCTPFYDCDHQCDLKLEEQFSKLEKEYEQYFRSMESVKLPQAAQPAQPGTSTGNDAVDLSLFKSAHSTLQNGLLPAMSAQSASQPAVNSRASSSQAGSRAGSLNTGTVRPPQRNQQKTTVRPLINPLAAGLWLAKPLVGAKLLDTKLKLPLIGAAVSQPLIANTLRNSFNNRNQNLFANTLPSPFSQPLLSPFSPLGKLRIRKDGEHEHEHDPDHDEAGKEAEIESNSIDEGVVGEVEYCDDETCQLQSQSWDHLTMSHLDNPAQASNDVPET